jgi:formylglycine-generating enzyme required for sulfatase activity
LRKAGSFAGSGDSAQVFDFGGNVAEWTTGPQGSGTLRGGSADAPSDPTVSINAVAPACRGFRVVREPSAP